MQTQWVGDGALTFCCESWHPQVSPLNLSPSSLDLHIEYASMSVRDNVESYRHEPAFTVRVRVVLKDTPLGMR